MGKTTVLTERIKYLIEQEKVNPAKILVVTFSKAASIEMRERFESLTEGKRLPVRFGTFHSLFFQVLRQAYHYEARDIVTPKLKYRFLEEALMETEYDDIEDRKEFLEEIEKEISKLKGEGTDISHYYSTNCPEEIFRSIYNGYQSRVQKNHCLDFDDMVLYTYQLFTARPDILERWQQQFEYILVDEFQDINRLQYENLKMLALPENNIFIVGDDDQSIYGFRGARPDIMLNFPKQYPGLDQVAIGENYRCSRQILMAASTLIGHNQKRYKKKLIAKKGDSDMVHVAQYADVHNQADAILRKIQGYMSAGVDVNEIAILFRTARQMNVIARKCMEFNIPFVMKDNVPNLFDHWIAKDIMTYLQMAGGNRGRGHFLKIMNRPKRYLSRSAFQNETVSFGELYEYYRDKPYMCERINTLQNDLFAMKQMTPYAAIDYIYKIVGYEDFLDEYSKERGVNVKEWYDIVEELKEDSAAYNTVEEWFEHIEEYRQQLEEKRMQKPEEPQEGVALMTMHGSKGLEFDVVFVPDVNDGIVPSSKSVEQGSMEEERRLMYVAMTRAREQLHISYVKERFRKDAKMSNFITELQKK